MAVLTNGRVSRFYLPRADGEFQDRNFCKLDLFQHSVDVVADAFSRFLHRDRVASGEALKQAQEELSEKTKNKEIMQILPQAWRDLLEESDEPLRALLIEKSNPCAGTYRRIKLLQIFCNSSINHRRYRRHRQSLPGLRKTAVSISRQTYRHPKSK